MGERMASAQGHETIPLKQTWNQAATASVLPAR